MSPNSETASHHSGASGNPPAANLPAQPLTNIAYALIALGLIGFAIALTHRPRPAGLGGVPGQPAVLPRDRAGRRGGVGRFYLTQARWAGRAHYRLAEAFSGFLIPGFILFWFLFFGRELIFPWIRHPIPAKTTWLNVPFLFLRDGLALAVMTWLSLMFLGCLARRRGSPMGGDLGQHPDAAAENTPAGACGVHLLRRGVLAALVRPGDVAVAAMALDAVRLVVFRRRVLERGRHDGACGSLSAARAAVRATSSPRAV